MAFNLTIESPNFEKIVKETGQFTRDAVNTIWAALNDTRSVVRRTYLELKNELKPAFLSLAPAGSTDNLDITNVSIISFTGGTAQNLTGLRAPETGEAKVVFISVLGAGTITMKNNATSDVGNRLSNATGADVTRATGQGIIYVYLSGAWREVARSS
jgi:hypothetical protein